MTVIELFDAQDPSAVYDRVTVGAAITYETGDAQSMFESRARLIPDRTGLIASFDGWSNGYVATRLRSASPTT